MAKVSYSTIVRTTSDRILEELYDSIGTPDPEYVRRVVATIDPEPGSAPWHFKQGEKYKKLETEWRNELESGYKLLAKLCHLDPEEPAETIAENNWEDSREGQQIARAAYRLHKLYEIHTGVAVGMLLNASHFHTCLMHPEWNLKNLIRFFAPKPRIDLIAQRCLQIQNEVMTRGKDTEYPTWRAVLSIVKHSEPAAWKQLSDAHSGFSEDETLRVLDGIEKPFFCSTFDSLRPEHCAGCQWLGRIKSPIALGWPREPKLKEVQNAA